MRNHSWKRRLFLSYIFIAVIPMLVLGTFFYFGNRESTKLDTDKSNLSMTSQVLQKLDYISEKMNSAAYHFSGTDIENELKEVRYNGKQIDDGIIISQLTTYSEVVNNSPDEKTSFLFLFLRGDKEIYTLDGKIPYMDFETQMNKYGDLNSKSFYTLINSTKKNISIKLETTENGFNNDDMVFFIYPIPYMNRLPIASIGFGFTTEALQNIIKTYYTVDSNIYIFNDMQQNIFMSSAQNTDSEIASELENFAEEYRKKGNRINHETIAGKQYIIMKEISVNSGMTMITITEKQKFYDFDNNSFVLLYIILLGILILGGIILALLLSKATYKPIGKLFDKILEDETEMVPGTEKNDRNEFEIITTKWSDLQNKNEEMNALINRQRPMVVSSCLKNILEGNYKYQEEMDSMLKLANINLGYHHCFVFLLPLPEDTEYEEEVSIKILSTLSNDALPFVHIYGLDMLKDAEIAIIVNFEKTGSEFEHRDIRITIAEHMMKKLDAAYGLTIPFYAGRIYDNLMDINRSFLEASTIAEDYRQIGNRKIILFEEIGREDSNIQYPVLEQALFIQCLKQANEPAALRALENMINEIEPLKSFIITQCLCFDIINAIIKTVDQMKGFELKDVNIKKAATFTSLHDFHEKVSNLTIEICRQFSAFRDQKNSELRTGILEYVNQNFTINDLGLEMVAEHFNVSSNYLSRFFKQEAGCSFIQYVTMLRMDKARELLINSDKQIKDIVSEIGYIDSANFVRKFKSYEGITPGQYRERMKKDI